MFALRLGATPSNCHSPQGGTVKRTLPSDSVLHLRYATRPGAPWAGISPLAHGRRDAGARLHGLSGASPRKPAPPQATFSPFPKGLT